MKRFGTLLTILVATSAGCAGPIADVGVIPPGSTSTSSTTSASTTVVTSTSMPSALASTTTTLAPAVGLISPRGVPVAILETNGMLHTVLTPCGREALLAYGTPIYATTVVIDPGHGGPVDTGSIAKGGLPEKEVNLRVARAVEELLLNQGISVVLTRTDDYPTRLFVRSNLADALQASLMVSIHHNAPNGFRSDEPGVEVFIQKDSVDSARLGGLLWERTTNAFANIDITWSAAGDAGVMTVLNPRGEDAYGLIRVTDTPTALIELGYMSNPSEARLFSTNAYPYLAAHAIVAAVEDYLDTDLSGSGFSAGRVLTPLPGISSARCEDPDLG